MTVEESACNGGSKVDVEKKMGFELRSEAEANVDGVVDGKLGESNGVVVVKDGSEVSMEDLGDLYQKVEPFDGNGAVKGFKQNLVIVDIEEPVEEAVSGREVNEVKEENDELGLANSTEQEVGSVLSTENFVAQVDQLKEAESLGSKEVGNVKEENGELSLDSSTEELSYVSVENIGVEVEQFKEAELSGSQKVDEVKENGKVSLENSTGQEVSSGSTENVGVLVEQLNEAESSDSQELDEVKEENGELNLENSTEQELSSASTENSRMQVEQLKGAESSDIQERNEVKVENGNSSKEDPIEQEVSSGLTDNLGVQVEQLKEAELLGSPEMEEVKEEDGGLSLENSTEQELNSVSAECTQVQVEQLKEAESLSSQKVDEVEEEDGELSMENSTERGVSYVLPENSGLQVEKLKKAAESSDNLIEENIESQSTHDSNDSSCINDYGTIDGNENRATREGEYKLQNHAGQVVDNDNQEALTETCEVESAKYQENGTAAEEMSHDAAAIEPANEVEKKPEPQIAQTNSLVVGRSVDDDERERCSSLVTGGNLHEESKSFSQEDDNKERLSVSKDTDQKQESGLGEYVDDVHVSKTAISDSYDSVEREATALMENQNSNQEEELNPTLVVEKVVQDPCIIPNFEQEIELDPATELQQECQISIPKNSKEAEAESADIMELPQESQASIPENSERAELESAFVEEQQEGPQVSIPENSGQAELESAATVELQQEYEVSTLENSARAEEGRNFNGAEENQQTELESVVDVPEEHNHQSSVVKTLASESSLLDNTSLSLEIGAHKDMCSDRNVFEASDGSFDDSKVSNGHQGEKDSYVKHVSSDDDTANSNLIVNHFATTKSDPAKESEFVKFDKVECVIRTMENDQLVNKKDIGVVAGPAIEIETQHVEEIEKEHLENIEAELVEKVEDKNLEESETQCVEDNRAEIEAEHVEEVESNWAAATEFELKEDIEPKPSTELLSGTDLSSRISDGEKVDMPVLKRQPCYIIKVPRFNNDELWTRIQNIQLEIEEKTQNRDSINILMQKQKITCTEYQKKYKAAQEEEVAARDAVRSTREKLEPIQSKLSKLKSAHSLEELDNKIQGMEYALQHETMPLKEEKKYIHELKLLRQQHEQLSSTMGPKFELDKAFGKKEQLNEEIKAIMKELDSLRNNMLHTETNTKSAWKRYNDEQKLLNDLRKQFEAANDVRQKSYEHLRNLKTELYEKNKYFHMYKNDKNVVENLKYSGDAKGLCLHCSNQVEKVMELWKNNEDFRKLYVECNKNSTLRRLRTLDGRSLGPDEEPPLLQNDRVNFPNLPSSTKTTVTLPTTPATKLELQEEKSPVPALQPLQKSKPAKIKNSVKPIPKDSKETSRSIDVQAEQVEHTTNARALSKVEEEQARKDEELARKEEELRKEKAAAELKEKQRLEQRVKAKEAEERKKRQAEKAQAKSEYKAKKEAEIKEKKRAKKDKKKGLADKDATNDEDEVGSVATDAAPSETARALDDPVQSSSKKPSRPLAAAKQYNKVQPVPLPLRNRSRRKTRTWMWVVLSALVVFILFLAGNYVSFNLNVPQFSS